MLFPAWGEEKALPPTLALLKMSPGKTDIPPALLAETEAGMGKILEGLGHYEISRQDLALAPEETTALFEKLKELKAKPVPLPDTVDLAGKAVPKAALEALVRASVVIVPAVVEYKVEEDKPRNAGGNGAGRFKVSVKTSFDFIKRNGEVSRATRLVETMGYDQDPARATGDAIRTILPLFSYELGLIQELKPAASILVLERGEAYIESGKKEGVLLGTEYVIRGKETRDTGQAAVKERGLIAISEVTDSVAVGPVLYADEDVAVGDAVEEVPRLGLDLTPYAFAYASYPEFGLSVYAGVRITLAKAVHLLRPFIAVESILYPFSMDWFPLRPFIGVEMRLHFGRLEIAALPMIGLEEWFALSSSPASSSLFLGFGLRGLIQASLLVSRDIKVFVEGGYEYWFGNRQGFLAGGGISIKL